MGMIAHWPLNGTLEDISGNEHTLTGSPTFSDTGKLGQGLDINRD